MSIIEHLKSAEALHFYGWWQASTCFFAFLALMAIWFHLGRKKNDDSQIWLALSVLCWSITGILEVVYSGIFKRLAEDAMAHENVSANLLHSTYNAVQTGEFERLSFQMEGLTSILSLTNSFLILLALPWFKHIPKVIKSVVNSKYWIIIIGLPFLFSVLPTLSKVVFSTQNQMISELDVYYSTLTLAFLGLVLWESFDKRRLKLLAWLSLLCILITFIAQVFKIAGNEIDMRLFSAIFKSALIMIFFALALSWVKDLAENILPPARSIFLNLVSQKNKEGRIQREVMIRGIEGKDNLAVHLSPGQYELLNTFVRYKMNEDDWLEIKPKNEQRGKSYPIKDHNELKRLTHSFLDSIYGKGNWLKDKHETAFKEAFYEIPEKRTRLIRLRIPVENITVNENVNNV